MRLFIQLLIIVCISSCHTSNRAVTTISTSKSNVLDSILRANPSFSRVVKGLDTFRLQVIYTQVNRNARNVPTFTDYTFNVNGDYFYPASTVKMPAALLALEKLNNLADKRVNKYTVMITDSSFEKQEIVYNNAQAEDGRPSIAEYIKQIFLVSDNDAFNRLYEFLGQEYLNKQLWKKGYQSAEIIHRLNVFLTEEQNRQTNAISFYDTSCNLLMQQAAQRSPLTYSGKNVSLGKGFYRGNQMVNEPFDFSKKNRLSLPDLHNILRAVIYPDAIAAKQRFDLTDEDYKFLYKYMSAYPREVKYPGYDSSYYDAYVKFLFYGKDKEQQPGTLRIFNKVGDAYGFLTDVAYIVDFDNKVEFMLSATLLCNTDGIFNDDKYDYETIGLPFVKNLGQAVYQYELNRLRRYKPDLSRFKIQK
jgi:hypothetical protein